MKKSATLTKTSEVNSIGMGDVSGIHWALQVTDLDFDSEGRVVIKSPELAARIKEDMKNGRHILVSSHNSDNYCVKESSQQCFVQNA